MTEEYIKEKYDKLSDSEIRNRIIINDKDSDEAVFYLLRYRLLSMLKAVYEQYHLPDELGDALTDFMLYLRNGRTGNAEPYKGMKGIMSALSFRFWLKRAFSNFLVDKTNNYKRQTDANKEYHNNLNDDDPVQREAHIKQVSTLIAWVHQTSNPDTRFLLYRHLMHILCNEEVIENRRIAEALGISYGNYRVRDSRLEAKIQECLKRMQKGEKPVLDEQHQKLANSIYEDFDNLKDILKDLYEKDLPHTSHWTTIQAVRKAEAEERRSAPRYSAKKPGDDIRFSIDTDMYSFTDLDRLVNGTKITMDFNDLCPRKIALSKFNDSLENKE